MGCSQCVGGLGRGIAEGVDEGGGSAQRDQRRLNKHRRLLIQL